MGYANMGVFIVGILAMFGTNLLLTLAVYVVIRFIVDKVVKDEKAIALTVYGLSFGIIVIISALASALSIGNIVTSFLGIMLLKWLDDKFFMKKDEDETLDE